MLVQLRRISAVVAVVLVGLGLVVLDPNGPTAMAYQGPPPAPITWVPSQVTEVPNTMTPEQWNRTLTQNPNKVIGNPATTGAGGSKIGVGPNGAAAAIGGFMLGTEIGTWAAGAMGLPTSGSFWCDLGTALTISECAMQSAPGYTPNADLGATGEPGWLNGVNVMQSGNAYRLEAHAIDESGTADGGTVTIRVNYRRFYASNLSTDGKIMAIFAYPVSGSSSLVRNFQRPANTVVEFQHDFVYSWPRSSSLPQSVTIRPTDFTGMPDLVYYPKVSTLRPPDPVVDPQRWWRTTWQCSAGAPGGSKTSEPFKETDAEWPGFPQAQCDAGSVVISYLVEQITQGVEGSTVIFEWAASDGYKEWANSECVGGGCELLLHRIDQVTGRRLSCFGDTSLCVDWSKDPNKEENFECSYGGKVIPLDNCLPYVPTFNPEAPGNYADPDGNPPSAPAPGPGGEPTPETPPRDESCPPPFTWTSLVNPWWYYKSTVCALQDVFVPTNSAAQMQRIKTAIDTTTPAVWAGEVSGMFEQVPAASGCQGPELHLTMFGLDKRAYPFSACEAPMSTAAPWVRGVATVLLVVFGSMAAVRALGSGFGWKPSAGGDS